MIDPEELLENIYDMESKGYDLEFIIKSVKARLVVETL